MVNSKNLRYFSFSIQFNSIQFTSTVFQQQQFDGDKEKAISAFLDSKEQGQPLTKKAKLEEIDLTKEEEGDNDDFEDQKEEESNNENNTDSDFDSNAFQFSRTLTKNNINQTNERFLKWFSKHAPPQLDKNGWIWILEMSEHNFEKSIPSDHKIIAFQNEWANLMKQLKSQNHQSQLQALEKQYPDFNFGSSKKQTKKQIQETLMKWISMKSVEYNYLSGKWMLFVHTTKASEIWKKICIWILNSPDCVVKTAKISTRPNGAENEHVICIYTDDFRDEKTLEKTAKQLREIGIKHKLMYKSDVYTELGIYSHDKEGNPFELRTTLKIDTV